jgi:hypothetical protein
LCLPSVGIERFEFGDLQRPVSQSAVEPIFRAVYRTNFMASGKLKSFSKPSTINSMLDFVQPSSILDVISSAYSSRIGAQCLFSKSAIHCEGRTISNTPFSTCCISNAVSRFSTIFGMIPVGNQRLQQPSWSFEHIRQSPLEYYWGPCLHVSTGIIVSETMLIYCGGQLVTSPLWAQELSFEHLLEIVRTHTESTNRSLITRLWVFTLLSLPVSSPVT